MINMIPSINNITYNSMPSPQGDFLHFFNQAIEMGYDPSEAKKWAKDKVKKKKEEKSKDRKVENSDKTKQTNHIDRRA